MFSITCEPSILRKLYNLRSCWAMSTCSCASETPKPEDAEVTQMREASYQLVDLRPEALFTDANWQTCVDPHSQQNLAAHMRRNLLLHNHCTHRATETYVAHVTRLFLRSTVAYSLAPETMLCVVCCVWCVVCACMCVHTYIRTCVVHSTPLWPPVAVQLW